MIKVNRSSRLHRCACALALLFGAATPLDAKPLAPPVPAREPHARTLHGETVVDDYFWLRDRKRPRTLAHLRAEAAYAEAMLQPTRALQNTIRAELLARTREDDAGPPYRRGPFEYVVREQKGKQHSVYCRRALDEHGAATGPERVVLDLNTIGKAGGFIELGAFEPSDDGMMLAYSLDVTGHEDFTLQVLDLRTGKRLAERLPRVDSIAWAADGKTFFYASEDAAKRAYRVYRHVLGQAKDALVYEEPDERFRVNIERSTDGALILVSSASYTASEVRFVSAATPEAPLALVAPRELYQQYEVTHHEGTLYIRTNRDAPNFRIVTAPLASPGVASWRDLVPGREVVTIQSHEVFSEYLVVSVLERGVPQLEVVDLATRTTHRVALDEPVHDVQLTLNYVFASPTFQLVYDSPVTPRSYFNYEPRTRTRTLVKRELVPTYNSSLYELSRVEVPASGGVLVPITVLQKKGVPHDGTAPLLIEAYGAYGLRVPDEFVDSAVSLLDRGVILVGAHVRGGGELGQAWHDAGRMMNKHNTFHDVIAVADWLVAHQYTSPAHLALQGGSAGGLLVAAVLNLRPALFRVAIADVPFVDVVNTMLDETIPLTVSEFEEWGDPKIAEHYRYMRSYCPYENILRTAYPSLLVTSALNDARAPYWEAAKWVAQLRALKTDANPLLFRIDLRPGGHGGPSGRYEQLDETARTYAFLLSQLGVSEAAAGGSR